jgi:GNAT superfamily N-acetyltransferase
MYVKSGDVLGRGRSGKASNGFKHKRRSRHLARGRGYGLSHRWFLNSIPPLDQLLGSIPPSPECLLIHDVAVLPHARGHGAAGILMGLAAALARKRGIPCLALVSVYGTRALWTRLGFEVISDGSLTDKLKSYGSTARYMIRRLD